jgi:hypothetical protein
MEEGRRGCQGYERQGEFVINYYHNGSKDCPMHLGMYKECDIKEKRDEIIKFAKENGFKVESGKGVHSIVLRSPIGDREGIITDKYFAASTSELFEAMGKEIHNLRTGELLSYC